MKTLDELYIYIISFIFQPSKWATTHMSGPAWDRFPVTRIGHWTYIHPSTVYTFYTPQIHPLSTWFSFQRFFRCDPSCTECGKPLLDHCLIRSTKMNPLVLGQNLLRCLKAEKIKGFEREMFHSIHQPHLKVILAMIPPFSKPNWEWSWVKSGSMQSFTNGICSLNRPWEEWTVKLSVTTSSATLISPCEGRLSRSSLKICFHQNPALLQSSKDFPLGIFSFWPNVL